MTACGAHHPTTSTTTCAVASRPVSSKVPPASRATARFCTGRPGAYDTVALPRSLPADATVTAPRPVADSAVTLSSAPVIDAAGMPDSVGSVTVRSPPGTRGPAGSRRES